MSKVFIMEYEPKGKVAVEKSLEWIQLDVTKNNPAHEFYLKAGYKEKNVRLEKKLL